MNSAAIGLVTCIVKLQADEIYLKMSPNNKKFLVSESDFLSS